jgi:hypothetical protein
VQEREINKATADLAHGRLRMEAAPPSGEDGGATTPTLERQGSPSVCSPSP